MEIAFTHLQMAFKAAGDLKKPGGTQAI